MLKLVSIKEKEGFDSSFDFMYEPSYRGRKKFECYFHIKDEVNNIIYIYTQEDIEKNFYYNNLEVQGLIKESTSCYLRGFDKTYEIPKVKYLYLYTELSKIVYGTRLSSFATTVVYQNIHFIHGRSVDFKSLEYEWAIRYDKYVKDKDNYGMLYNKQGLSYYKEYSCDLSHSVCLVSSIIERINLWRSLNKINTYNRLFERCDEHNLDLTEFNTKGIFDFQRFLADSYNLISLKVCDLDMSMPIILFDMLHNCYNLQKVDFTNLSNDYPEDNFGLNEHITLEKLYVADFSNSSSKYKGFKFKDSMLFIFNNKTPRFTKQFANSNGLKFLGNVKKGSYTIDTLIAKRVLLGKPLEGPYFVIENN